MFEGFVNKQQQRQNMHKALLGFANKGCLLPRVFMPSITFKAPYNKLLQFMLLPPLVFSQIYHCYKNAWNTIIVPSQQRLREFLDIAEAAQCICRPPSVGFQPSICNQNGAISFPWGWHPSDWDWENLEQAINHFLMEQHAWKGQQQIHADASLVLL